MDRGAARPVKPAQQQSLIGGERVHGEDGVQGGIQLGLNTCDGQHGPQWECNVLHPQEHLHTVVVGNNNIGCGQQWTAGVQAVSILVTLVLVHKKEFLFLNSLKGFWRSVAEIS
jgi:hypothetical protein